MEPETNHIQVSVEETPKQEECSICVEPFTSNERKPITCPKCNIIVCKKCVQTFLKTISDEPYCMNCKFGWDNTFLFNNINKTFINSELKKARTLRTYETEKARFPETMAELEEFNEHKKKISQYDEIYKNRQDILDQISTLEIQLRELRHKSMDYGELLYQIRYINENRCDPLKVNQYFRQQSKPKQKVTREFKHPCPAEGCNGIMGKNWTCPVCETHACSKCFENLGKNPKKDEHECKKENLESANEIRKNTRACPTCAVPIFKISGCDQMWCTQCQVAFSWTSGKIIRGNRIHNPHYYQALQAGNINVARNPGDQICGGIPLAHHMSRKFRAFNGIKIEDFYEANSNGYRNTRISSKKEIVKNDILVKHPNANLYSFLLYITRNFHHNEDVIINRMRTQIQNNTDNSDIRMRFITKEITEAEFKRNLCMRNTKRYKTNELLQIIELFHTVCTDNMRSIYNINPEEFDNSMERIKDIIMNTYIKNIQRIRQYCNEQFVQFHKNNNLTTHYITDLFEIVSSSDKKHRIEEGY